MSEQGSKAGSPLDGRRSRDRLTRWQRSRLKAPPGYRWTDGEVLFEKTDSAINGFGVGFIAGMALGTLLGVVL